MIKLSKVETGYYVGYYGNYTIKIEKRWDGLWNAFMFEGGEQVCKYVSGSKKYAKYLLEQKLGLNPEYKERKTTVRTRPNKVVDSLTLQLMTVFLPKILANFKDEHLEEVLSQYSIYVVNQTRGWCRYKKKWITIPSWVFSKGESTIVYYLAHELAHAYTKMKYGYQDNHGPKFMSSFISICPTEYQYHEYGYKPRNAKSAGVAQKNS